MFRMTATAIVRRGGVRIYRGNGCANPGMWTLVGSVYRSSPSSALYVQLVLAHGRRTRIHFHMQKPIYAAAPGALRSILAPRIVGGICRGRSECVLRHRNKIAACKKLQSSCSIAWRASFHCSNWNVTVVFFSIDIEDAEVNSFRAGAVGGHTAIRLFITLDWNELTYNLSI